MADHSQSDSTAMDHFQENGFDFEHSIAAAEEKIQDLKQRRQKIQASREKYRTVQSRIQGEQVVESVQDGQKIEEELGQIELEMVNELYDWVGKDYLSWNSPGEKFWTFFRYAGIGFVAAIAINYLRG